MESAERRTAVNNFAAPSRMLGMVGGLLGLGLLAALVAALALAALAPQRAQAQTGPTVVGTPELRIAIDDSDGIIPVDTTDLVVLMVLRVELDQAIDKDNITAASASGIKLRSTGGVERTAGSAATGHETCGTTTDEPLIWACTVASFNADFFGLSTGQFTFSVDSGAEYSLTITGANNGNPITGTLGAATLVVTVGDVAEVQTVTLEPAEGETTTRLAGGDGIELVLKILNENNAAADSSAIASIFVSAAPLTLASSAPGAECSAAACSWSATSARQLGARGAGAIALTVSSSRAGSAELTAQVVTSNGEVISARSPRLTFSGAASAIALGEPSGALLSEQIDGDRDEIRISVTATDAAGNETPPPTRLTLTLRDPNGGTVAATRISREQLAADGSGRVYIRLRTLAASGSPLVPGEYTLRAARGSAQDEQTFRVAGKAAAIALSELPIVWSGDVGLMRVIADVTDAQGQPVADGTPVVFSTQAVTAQLVSRGSATVGTVGGRASLEFLVVQPGTAAVSATADGQQATDVVTATPPSAENTNDSATEPVGLDGLGSTRLDSLTTWLGDAPTTAGALYDLLTPRGATALWTWRANEQRWIPYSELADGRRTPGAVDFTITRGDILWLSG